MSRRRTHRAVRRSPTAGFALLEVLLALSLLSIGIVSVLGALQNSLRVVNDAETFTRAELLGASLFAAWRMEPPENGSLQGRSIDGEIRWRLQVKGWAPQWDELVGEPREEASFRRHLRLATLTLEWSEGSRTRSLVRQELLRVDG